MSIGPLAGIIGSAAGSPLAQTQGSEPERAQQDAAVQQRRTDSDKKAEAAAGIGEANGEDHEAEDRDADGRRLWEPSSEGNAETPKGAAGPSRQSKDATGESGNLLDLSG
ncbi:MAG TPA: hypothetical protein VMY42_18745 [Thermoguttaceae bacterium]|nr:hypothetical protein [Thermoguttaceae bacterium]